MTEILSSEKGRSTLLRKFDWAYCAGEPKFQVVPMLYHGSGQSDTRRQYEAADVDCMKQRDVRVIPGAAGLIEGEAHGPIYRSLVEPKYGSEKGDRHASRVLHFAC